MLKLIFGIPESRGSGKAMAWKGAAKGPEIDFYPLGNAFPLALNSNTINRKQTSVISLIATLCRHTHQPVC